MIPYLHFVESFVERRNSQYEVWLKIFAFGINRDRFHSLNKTPADFWRRGSKNKIFVRKYSSKLNSTAKACLSPYCALIEGFLWPSWRCGKAAAPWFPFLYRSSLPIGCWWSECSIYFISYVFKLNLFDSVSVV